MKAAREEKSRMSIRNRAARWFAIVALVAASGLVAPRAEALTINLTFGAGFDTDVKKAVAQQAVNEWQAALPYNYTFALTVDITSGTNWTATPNSAVGRMRDNAESAAVDPTTNTKLPTSGTVELNSNFSLYFDSSPADNSEFNMTQENGRFGNATATGGASGSWDALSVLEHEIGHALGFSRTTGTWSDGKPYTAYTDFLNNFTGATYKFDFLTTGTEGNKTGAGGALTQVGFDADSHIDGSGQPALNRKMMANPGFGISQRSLITPLDLDIIGDAFHLAINESAVPEPDTAALFSVGLVALARLGRRR
jgi:PEP-CTERM motif